MKHTSFRWLLLVAVLLSPASAALAAEGTVSDSARVRSAPGTVNTRILRVLPKGTAVTILEEKNGWYHISTKQTDGWMAAELITKSPFKEEPAPAADTAEATGEYTVSGRLRAGAGTTFASLLTVPKGARVTIFQTKNGWYEVSYKGKRGWSANTVMKKVTATAPTPAEKPVAAPEPTEKPTVVPAEPITIPDKNLPVTSAPREAPTPKVYANAPTTPLDPGNIHKSSVQAGDLPTDIDLVALNKYWLDKVNAVRAERNLRQLMLDQRWVDTATEYAATIGEKGKLTHDRPNGRTMHQWVNGKGLQFTVRNSAGGWKTNYFTENLSRGVTDGAMANVQVVLDQAMEYFLNEGEAGAHYKTVYHQDWNSTGLGFYFKARADGQYDVFVVYHYGSLQM